MNDEVVEVSRNLAPLGAAAEAAADPADAAGEANVAGADALAAEAVEEAFGAVAEPPPKRQRLSQGPLGQGRWQRTRLGQAFMTQVRLRKRAERVAAQQPFGAVGEAWGKAVALRVGEHASSEARRHRGHGQKKRLLRPRPRPAPRTFTMRGILPLGVVSVARGASHQIRRAQDHAGNVVGGQRLAAMGCTAAVFRRAQARRV